MCFSVLVLSCCRNSVDCEIVKVDVNVNVETDKLVYCDKRLLQSRLQNKAQEENDQAKHCTSGETVP